MIDGLRGQPGVIDVDLMDTIVYTFYRRQRRRLMKLIGELKSLEIPLSKSITDEIACIESGREHGR